jgi:hypothetical protein
VAYVRTGKTSSRATAEGRKRCPSFVICRPQSRSSLCLMRAFEFNDGRSDQDRTSLNRTGKSVSVLATLFTKSCYSAFAPALNLGHIPSQSGALITHPCENWRLWRRLTPAGWALSR